MENRKISLCITTHNRTWMLMRSFDQLLNDDRVSEIIIVDDASTSTIWNEVSIDIGILKSNKVKLFRNDANLGCYRNKKEAISKASNEFVIIADSDNIFSKAYVDKIYAYGLWDVNTIYAPSFAKPFDYRYFEGRIIHRQNVAKFVDVKHFDAMINTMNYFVNRDEYIRVWEDREEPWTADSLYQNYRWLDAGNRFFVVPGLQYEHTVHDGSHYKEHNKKTGNLFNETINKLKLMR